MSLETEPTLTPKTLRLLVAYLGVFGSRVMLRLGLRQRVDGWRRGAGLLLKGEAAKFVLSAFNLNVLPSDPSDDDQTIEGIRRRLATRLAEFLQAESEFHLLVRHEVDQDRVIPHSEPSYTLGFEPWVDGPGRFIRPDSWAGPDGTAPVAGASPVFQFVCRINSDHLADVWVRVNHVAADGIPTQEMLSRLQKAWGVGKPVIVPGREEFEPHTAPRSTPGRAGTVEVQTFLNFGPLLAWRKRQNLMLPEPMTFSAAIFWWLARHEVFSRRYMGTTAQIPVADGMACGVGAVVVRPGDYFNQPNGLARYVKAFNRQLKLTRERKSAIYKKVEAVATLPAKLAETVFRHGLDRGARAFGSVGLTILKGATIFGAPLGDTGHINGFIAIGDVSLESADGKRVGCVVVKGPRERISSYARILREAIEQAGMD